MKVQKSAEVGRCRQQPEKKDAYIGKIIPNRVDSAPSIHIMAVVVQFFSSHPSHPRGGSPASEVPHGSWLVVPRPRASHDTSASHRRPMRTYNSELHHNDEELRIPPV